MRKINKGQQEMVGFVLIVVLVVVAAMVFLVISMKQKQGDVGESIEIENLISAILESTTDCAIVFEPQYSNVEDLIKSCQENDICSNLDKSACDYLDEKLNEIMIDVMNTEAKISAYELFVASRSGENEDLIIPVIKQGNCTGSVQGSQAIINQAYGDIVFRMKVC